MRAGARFIASARPTAAIRCAPAPGPPVPSSQARHPPHPLPPRAQPLFAVVARTATRAAPVSSRAVSRYGTADRAKAVPCPAYVATAA